MNRLIAIGTIAIKREIAVTAIIKGFAAITAVNPLIAADRPPVAAVAAVSAAVKVVAATASFICAFSNPAALIAAIVACSENCNVAIVAAVCVAVKPDAFKDEATCSALRPLKLTVAAICASFNPCNDKFKESNVAFDILPLTAISFNIAETLPMDLSDISIKYSCFLMGICYNMVELN